MNKLDIEIHAAFATLQSLLAKKHAALTNGFLRRLVEHADFCVDKGYDAWIAIQARDVTAASLGEHC